MKPPRTHIALAVDGGGMRGLMVARALVALEQALGGQPLIEHPAVNVLAGTSTGALIVACLAMGYHANEIVDFYLDDGPVLLDAHVPAWIPGKARRLWQVVTGMSRSGVYSSQRFKDILRRMIGYKTGNPDLTLRDLKKRLRPNQTLIISVADVTERHPRFLKSSLESDGDWKLWEAIRRACQ